MAAIQSRGSLLSILARIAGALGLLQLIQDVTPLKLKGLILEWFSAYSGVVAFVHLHLFSWIKFWILSVTKVETNLLMFCGIVAGGICRSAISEASTGSTRRNEIAAIVYIYTLTLILLPLMIVVSMPQLASVIVIALIFLLHVPFFLDDEIPRERWLLFPEWRIVVREISNVFIYAAIVIAVSYAFF